MHTYSGVLVRIVTRLRAGRSELDSWQEQGLFLFATESRPVLGPTQPPIQCISWRITQG